MHGSFPIFSFLTDELWFVARILLHFGEIFFMPFSSSSASFVFKPAIKHLNENVAYYDLEQVEELNCKMK